MEKVKSKNFCEHCGLSRWYHFQTWIDGLLDHLLPFNPAMRMPGSVDQVVSYLLESLVTVVGLVKKVYDFPSDDLSPRSRVFVEAARKRGISVYVLKGRFGYSNQFGMHVGNKIFRFEGLPTFQGSLDKKINLDSKMAVKRVLVENDWPVANGRTFWFWQKQSALNYGAKIGYPLVVKPENGSVARHVTTNITSPEELSLALNLAFKFSPVIILEKFVEGFVHRVSVIAGESVFVVKQLPAHIEGDGHRNISDLIAEKNKDPKRGSVGDSRFLLHPIILGRETDGLLSAQKFKLTDVPPAGTRVYLRRDPFMRYGGELEACTKDFHPDNVFVCKALAKTFGAFLVGMDFVLADATRSYKEQPSAILELNGLPCIDMHHFPSYGNAENIAEVLLDETLKKLS